MNPGVAAGDWAVSPAPPCPGLSLLGLQCRDEGSYRFSPSSGMHLHHAHLLEKWGGGKTDKRESIREEAQTPAAARGRKPHLQQGLQPLPAPLTPV